MDKKDADCKIGGVFRKTKGGKTYLVKSVFVGNKDIKTSILKLAERKAIKEMGLA